MLLCTYSDSTSPVKTTSLSSKPVIADVTKPEKQDIAVSKASGRKRNQQMVGSESDEPVLNKIQSGKNAMANSKAKDPLSTILKQSAAIAADVAEQKRTMTRSSNAAPTQAAEMPVVVHTKRTRSNYQQENFPQTQPDDIL